MAVKENVLTLTDDFIKVVPAEDREVPQELQSFLFGDRLVELQLFDLLENLIGKPVTRKTKSRVSARPISESRS